MTFSKNKFQLGNVRLKIYLQAIIRKISEWNSVHNTTEHFIYKPLISTIELLISEPSLRTMVGVGRRLSWQIACQACKYKDCWVRCSAPTNKHTRIPSISEVEAGGSLGHQDLASVLMDPHALVYLHPQTWTHKWHITVLICIFPRMKIGYFCTSNRF